MRPSAEGLDILNAQVSIQFYGCNKYDHSGMLSPFRHHAEQRLREMTTALKLHISIIAMCCLKTANDGGAKKLLVSSRDEQAACARAFASNCSP